MIALIVLIVLICEEVTHESYLNEGQWKTNKVDMVLGHIKINLYPVFVWMPQCIKKRKDDDVQKNKNLWFLD